jgi:hypothetical protein
MALRLMEENVMPTSNNEMAEVCNNSNEERSADKYDDDDRTPVELEFLSLTSSFLSYTERDIRSLTTTYTQPVRSKEDGIRYRTLYVGVQAASSEPEVLRAFTILFDDYLPIRLAGRKIYAHLTSVMDVVRQERVAEIARTCELCPDWARIYMDDDDGGRQQTVIEYARDVWDEISDEAMLLEDQSLDSSATGVIFLSQLIHLGIDQLLIQDRSVSNIVELQCLVRAIVLQEGREMEEQYTTTTTKKVLPVHYDDTKEIEMTFATFMKVIYCTLSTQPDSGNNIIRPMLQKIERLMLEHRSSSDHHLNKEDVSTRLAAKASITGSTRRCKWSQRFDEYVSQFIYWEQHFLNLNNENIDHQTTPTTSNNRRFEILQGCFVGARNEKNVAALKIVYMDYAALRIGGDLIFQLMSKIVNKLM